MFIFEVLFCGDYFCGRYREFAWIGLFGFIYILSVLTITEYIVNYIIAKVKKLIS